MTKLLYNRANNVTDNSKFDRVVVIHISISRNLEKKLASAIDFIQFNNSVTFEVMT